MGLRQSPSGKEDLILAFDTSGRAGSAAIGFGDNIIAEKDFQGQMKHSTELFSQVKTLCSQIDLSPSDINQLYITVGPGSFTGLRIAITFAKMSHLANNKLKIVSLNTLDVLAENMKNLDYDRIGVVLDAKRGMFFAAVYEKRDGQLVKTFKPDLITAQDFLKSIDNKPIIIAGEGLVYYRNKFKKDCVSFADESLWPVKAANVYKMGLKSAQNGYFVNALELSPDYVRGHDAKIKKSI